MSEVIQYKDVTVPLVLNGMINHMSDVENYREELTNLGGQWDLLTILGQMSGTGMDMSETRQGFQRLTSELLGQLGLEILNKTVREIAGKAQVTVDIVIRNLFERTADIGFLATDDDIRSFLKTSVLSDSVANQSDTDALIARFQEYVAKYSVYFNIILLDPSGRILVQLDPENDVCQSSDPLIQQALTTTDDYVEVYRHSDLLDDEEQSLIYAYRVTESNDTKSTALGVLCLCFRFDNEMQGIFQNLQKENDWSVLTLLDARGRVIASSDTHQMPLGIGMEVDLESDFRIIRFAGREYLAKTCATKGYQGFYGLDWYGHVMIPLEHAFDRESISGLKNMVEPHVLDAVMQDSRLFSQHLRSIPVQAEHIQEELERTVWNGNVRESDAQSKVLLWNISDAGARTNRVFGDSIGNLHETVVSGLLNSVVFQADLAVDIMDRNLYERANDCRWWALTSDFRRVLAEPQVTEQGTQEISSILAYINGLYTVYTNLFIFDVRGTVLAVSSSGSSGLVGKTLSEKWIQEVLNLKGTQNYSVSTFHATDLYDGEHTYIYSAAIRHPEDERRCIGGVGIVFDSTPQFKEMLNDSLLRDKNGEVVDGCFAVFTDRSGQIISSTDDRFVIGTRLSIDEHYFGLQRGGSLSGIVTLANEYYAVGVRTSSGYREYKVNDGYENDIVGLVFMPLAQVQTEVSEKQLKQNFVNGSGNARDTGSVVELATFYICGQWFGVSSDKVLEAIYAKRIISIPGSAKLILGKTMYRDRLISVIDLRSQLSRKTRPVLETTASPIVILATEEDPIGLVVDTLGQIPAVNKDRMEPIHLVQQSKSNYLECLVKPNVGDEQKSILLVIDPKKLFNIAISDEDAIVLETIG